VKEDDRRARTAEIETEAAAIRRRLDELLDELDDRRRRAVFSVAQLKAYALPALAGAALVGGVVAVVAWRRHVAARRLSAWPRHVKTAAIAALAARLGRLQK
jgi:hypothetical protein